MPHDDDTPDVEHIFFSERLAPATDSAPPAERRDAPGPWAMYTGARDHEPAVAERAADSVPEWSFDLRIAEPGPKAAFPWGWIEFGD